MSLGEREKEGLKEENKDLRDEISSLKYELTELKQLILSMNPKNQEQAENSSTTSNTNQTVDVETQTDTQDSALSSPLFSSGNRGVQTNRQTDDMPAMPDMLEAVSQLKSELKQKFRGLTKQEFRVFSAIYMLEEQENSPVDYPIIAGKLSLSETAIRDYVMKLKRKGIPIIKTKINNKKVLLNIRQELKQLACLDALIKIREPVFR